MTLWYLKKQFSEILNFIGKPQKTCLTSKVSVLETMGKLDLNYDATAILTEWRSLKLLTFQRLLVFDGRGILSSSNYSIGKG